MLRWLKNPFWTMSITVLKSGDLTWSMPGYWIFPLGLVIQLNLTIWSGIGLWKAIEVIF
jgi:hypothetical protein